MSHFLAQCLMTYSYLTGSFPYHHLNNKVLVISKTKLFLKCIYYALYVTSYILISYPNVPYLILLSLSFHGTLLILEIKASFSALKYWNAALPLMEMHSSAKYQIVKFHIHLSFMLCVAISASFTYIVKEKYELNFIRLSYANVSMFGELYEVIVFLRIILVDLEVNLAEMKNYSKNIISYAIIERWKIDFIRITHLVNPWIQEKGAVLLMLLATELAILCKWSNELITAGNLFDKVLVVIRMSTTIFRVTLQCWYSRKVTDMGDELYKRSFNINIQYLEKSTLDNLESLQDLLKNIKLEIKVFNTIVFNMKLAFQTICLIATYSILFVQLRK